MKKIISLLLCIALLLSFVSVSASDNINISLDGNPVQFQFPPIIHEGRTMLHLRSFAELFNYQIEWDSYSQSITLTSDGNYIYMSIGDPQIYSYGYNGYKSITADVPPMIIGDYTYLPLRAVASAFNTYVSWNQSTRTVELLSGGKKFHVDGVCNHTFYFQNQKDWQLPNFGNSYCWVTCYAMILNDIVGNVTPLDVAKVNEEQCGDGAFCHHFPIVEKFGATFVPAISEDSPYFEMFTDYFSTYIKNEEKDDAIAIAAIKEALDRNPEGIMVRFDEKPHTIVAVSYEGDVIYFNEPMPYHHGVYDTKTPYEHVTFDKTYPAIKGYKLSDMTCIIAID